MTPKLAYRLKAGLSYQLSPEISAFAGGFYHRVVGDDVYESRGIKIVGVQHHA
ncbi:P44/Msp2 family outer membrane protein [Anaplasma phagocytophilum]|uniref:P44/Msp2 family outer membrane protein n=1 Tax=Anaplasma phagocytophilum TaxID=948 RepID=UPI0009B87923